MARKRKQPDQKAEKFPLRLEWRSPAELAENPRNWRVHLENQQAALAGAMMEVGWAGACLYNEATGRLIDGHLRRKVAQAQGCDLVPVLVGTWTEDQEAKILATLDPLAGMAGADPVILDDLLKGVHTGCDDLRDMLTDLWDDVQADAIAGTETADPVDAEPQTDRAEELRKKWGTAAGQLWLLGRHRLLCGDSTKAEDVARVMGGESFAVIATDPPYGIDHPTEYRDRNRCNLATCRNYPRVAGDNVPFDPSPILGYDKPTILWGGNYFASRLPDSSGWLVWDKDRPDDLDQATCELAWTNCVKGVRRMRYLWNGMMREGDEDLVHPTQKPIAVVQWSLSIRWIPDGAVYDPFLGSGTTLIAAENLGRRCFGIEISPAYCAVILQRFADAFPGQEIRRAD